MIGIKVVLSGDKGVLPASGGGKENSSIKVSLAVAFNNVAKSYP